MAFTFFCWEFLAFVGFVSLWRFARSYLKVKGIPSRYVFITGCDTGFGRLLAESLDREGVNVFAGCFSKDHAEELKEKSSSKLATVQLDVSDSKSVRKAVEFVEEKLNGKALWGLVNNAGISGVHVPFEWSTKEDCRRVLEVNLLGPYDVTLAFLPLIKRGKEGRIVNVSSIAGRISLSVGGYSLSKYGIEALSDGLSVELRPYNITVHTITPGMFKTNISSGENMTTGLRKRYSALSDEMQNQFGGQEYLDKLVAYFGNLLDSNLCPKLHLVVEAYQRALFDRYPKNRYIVGNDAKFFFIPLSWIPFGYQMMVFSLLERFTGVKKPVAKDAVVKD